MHMVISYARLGGLYELETVEMLIDAFSNSEMAGKKYECND